MFLPPFSMIEKFLVSKNVQASVIRLLIAEAIRNNPFDESAYLDANPDVALAVERGEWANGRAHFAAIGYFEGRVTGSVPFSRGWYLATYPDVREALASGDLASAEDHYISTGMYEWRTPSPEAAEDIAKWREALTPQRGDRQSRFVESNQIVNEALQKQNLELSPVLHPVGTLSPKGDLLLGRNGCVFLIGGADPPLSQYGRPAEDVAATADEVVHLFEQRRGRLAEQHIRYLQIVIPEKLSIVPDLFPAEIAVPTTLLRSVEQRAENAALSACYLSCFNLFQDDARAGQIFRPVDTHLAPYGAYRLMQGISEFLGLAAFPELVFDRQRMTGADVSDRFFSIIETYNECEDGWAAAPEKIAESRVTLGHFGKRQSWACHGAPNAVKVLVCGNSYVGYAEQGQYTLAWWLARLFSGFEFIWTAGLDWDLVAECRPDIVICQTVERFLHRIPAS